MWVDHSWPWLWPMGSHDGVVGGPDSDWGYFRPRRAVDISSFIYDNKICWVVEFLLVFVDADCGDSQGQPAADISPAVPDSGQYLPGLWHAARHRGSLLQTWCGEWQLWNPYHEEFVLWRMEMFRHILSFFDTKIAQVIEILYLKRQRIAFGTQSIPWLIIAIFQFQHHDD